VSCGSYSPEGQQQEEPLIIIALACTVCPKPDRGEIALVMVCKFMRVPREKQRTGSEPEYKNLSTELLPSLNWCSGGHDGRCDKALDYESNGQHARFRRLANWRAVLASKFRALRCLNSVVHIS
jgi:hypothetical protein